jgi:hypothetical protein
MLKKCLALTLMMLVFNLGAGLVLAGAQARKDARRAAQIKGEIARRGTGHNVRVRIKLRDGTKLKGYISQAGENDFVIRDDESGTSKTVAYGDVTQVKGKGLSTGRKILIGIGVWLGIGVILTGAGP